MRVILTSVLFPFVLLSPFLKPAHSAEYRVNTYTTNDQISPAVAMDSDGDFVIVWQSREQDGDHFGIFAQRYSKDGTPAGNEFQVNTYTTNQQARPAVAMDADGDFVVVWHSEGQDVSEEYTMIIVTCSSYPRPLPGSWVRNRKSNLL